MFSLNKNNLEIYKVLKGQNHEISFLNYYKSFKNEEYLLSTDIVNKIIIWSISNDYEILQIIETNYELKMYSNLLLFTPKEYYIVTTCSTTFSNFNLNNYNNLYSRIYSLKNGELIRNIPGTDYNNTFNIIKWYNIKDNNYYIIECCEGKIFIYNITNDELYIIFFTEIETENFYEGFIYSKKDNDYLLSGDDHGRVFIWNLNTKNIFHIIYISNDDILKNQIYHIKKWDENYFFINEFNNNSIIFIDFEQLKQVSCYKFKCDNYNIIEDIKVINFPLYGKSLIISKDSNTIEIWGLI